MLYFVGYDTWAILSVVLWRLITLLIALMRVRERLTGLDLGQTAEDVNARSGVTLQTSYQLPATKASR